MKRKSSDAYSGTVIGVSNTCTLRPAFLKPPAQNWKTWEHSNGNELSGIPESEITLCSDFENGDYIVHKGWIGVIKEVYDAVTIRLKDGSVVEVEDPEDLELTAGSAKLGTWGPRQALDLFAFLQKQLNTSYGSGKTRPIETKNHVGQTVVTKKGNLRRGDWKFGAYNPNTIPQGVVVEVRPSGFDVTWLHPNYFSYAPKSPEPPSELAFEELEGNSVRYDRSRLPQGHVLNTFSDVAAGNHVRFRDLAGAACKYSEETKSANPSNSSGTFLRIPRTATQGYDMNIFQVRETHTRVDIQWQDGSYTQEDSTKLLPYLNVDDHDVWPGELVATKENIENDRGNILPQRVGVVQSTNAKERLACVRWFVDSHIEIAGIDKEILLPGSALGTISEDISTVSLYEIEAFQALSKRRGDLVLLNYNPANAQRENTPTGSLLSRVAHIWGSSEAHYVNWVGEIIDLRLDGQMTVRLGAQQNVQDVTTSIVNVISVVGGDDNSSFSGSDTSDLSEDEFRGEDSEGLSVVSAQPLEETVEYEGGERLDSERGDEMWTTEDEATGSGSSNSITSEDTSSTDGGETVFDDPTMTSAIRPHTDIPAEPQTKSEAENMKTPSGPSAERSYYLEKKDISALTSVNWPDMPSQFDSLEGVPDDHHFRHVARGLGAKALRRIRKDHSMLASSLPDGTFVRTWESRLDLIRVIIVGPRSTPYELAPFVFDFQFATDYPNTPPSAYFHSWTSRVNPNLYEDGTICLSLLGTWRSEGKNESWSPDGSSMLQVIVSIMGLVLVKEPYYSELMILNMFSTRYDDLSAFGSSTDS